MRVLGLLLVASACTPRLYTDGTSGGEACAGAPWSEPDNSWDVTAPPADLVGEGMAEGDVACDVTGVDQHGDVLRMWQFYGSWILVDLSTMWCGPCRELATGTEEVWQEFRDRGFVYLTVLHENDQNRAPTAEDLELWTQFPSFHKDGDHPYERITAPVIADPKGRSGSGKAIEGQASYPKALIVGPDMVVVDDIEPVSEARIVEILEEILPE